MPASRWNSNILEMLNWLYEQQNDLEELLAHPIVPRVISNDGEKTPESDAQDGLPQASPLCARGRAR